MFLLSLRATSQVWTVSLKAGLYTYKALEPTAYSFGFAYASGGGSPLAFGVGHCIVAGTDPGLFAVVIAQRGRTILWRYQRPEPLLTSMRRR
jgi:hypothetical protein